MAPPCGCTHARTSALSHGLVAVLAVLLVILLLLLAVGVANIHICGDEIAALWGVGFHGWRWLPTMIRR